jgi:hypothetical protein
MRIKMKTESVVGNLPIANGDYLGKWEGFRVVIPFEDFEINFIVQDKATDRSTRSGAKTCKVSVTDGIALVEAK